MSNSLLLILRLCVRTVVGLVFGLPIVALFSVILAIVSAAIVFGVILLSGCVLVIASVLNLVEVKPVPVRMSGNVMPFPHSKAPA